MEVRVLAGHDGREQAAVEAQAVDPAELQRMARDLEDDGRGACVGEAAQGAVELDRRRSRQAFAGIVEGPVARSERAQYARPLTSDIEELAQDVARARLPEGPRESDDRERHARRLKEAGG